MNLQDRLNIINDLQTQINEFGTLDTEIQNKINYKFRLDWNYYSNAMEGNSLTKVETRQLMMDNITIGGKSFKDVTEMKGHDAEVQEIMKIGKGAVRISEKRIKDMHKAIMHEENPEKRKQIGKWKTENNYLINYKEERFDFLDHTEVKDAMHDMLNRFNAVLDKKESGKTLGVELPLLAFQFHREYIQIHPFYDGNGRTARLLTNLILISLGYPPIILSDINKTQYYKLLADVQAYGGDLDLLYGFMSDLLIDSQRLVLSALNGEDIEERDDVEKEIILWKKSLETKEELISKNLGVIYVKYNDSIRPLLSLFLEKHLELFSDLFNSHEVVNWVNNGSSPNENLDGFDRRIMEIENYLKEIDLVDVKKPEPDLIDYLKLEIRFEGFKKDGVNTFKRTVNLNIDFEDYKYLVYFNNNNQEEIVTKLYSENLSTDEINKIIQGSVKAEFEFIKQSMSNNKPKL